MTFEHLERRQLLSAAGLITQQPLPPVLLAQGKPVQFFPLKGVFQEADGSPLGRMSYSVAGDSNASLFSTPPVVLPFGCLQFQIAPGAAGISQITVLGTDARGQSALATIDAVLSGGVGPSNSTVPAALLSDGPGSFDGPPWPAAMQPGAAHGTGAAATPQISGGGIGYQNVPGNMAANDSSSGCGGGGEWDPEFWGCQCGSGTSYTETDLFASSYEVPAGCSVGLTAYVLDADGYPQGLGDNVEFAYLGSADPTYPAEVLDSAIIGYYYSANFSTSSLPVGIDYVEAGFPGDATYAPSLSNVIPIEVDPWVSITGLPPTVVTCGEPITLGSRVTDNTGSALTVQNYTWTVTAPNGTTAPVTVSGSNCTFTPTIAGSYNVVLGATVNGATGTAAATVAATLPNVSITNLPPDNTLAEGGSWTLQSSVTDANGHSLTADSYAWSVDDFNGEAVPSGSSNNYTFTPPDSGAYNITLTATVHGFSFPTTQTIDVPPQIVVGPPSSTVAGTEVDLTAAPKYPSSVDAAAGFSYNWTVTKDGNYIASGFGPNISLTPDTKGDYLVSVTATDADGLTSDPATQHVNVTPMPSQVMIGALVPVASESLGSVPGATTGMGEFVVTRSDGSAGTVTVNYTIASGPGNAVDGTDYTMPGSNAASLTGSVTFNGSETSEIVYVTPIQRNIVGGSKTVTLTLAAGTGYTVMSSFPTAAVTIYDDDSAPSSGPVVSQITCFNTEGVNEGATATAAVGDPIPIAVSASSGNPVGMPVYLNYGSTLIVSTDSNPSDLSAIIPSGTQIALTTSNTMYYIFAANPNSASTVSDSVYLTGGTGVGTFLGCSATLTFDPLRLYRDGIDITGGAAPGNRNCNVRVGEKVNLSVPTFLVGDIPQHDVIVGPITWDAIPGSVVKDYQPTDGKGNAVESCSPVPLTIVDRLGLITPGKLSFAWVDGGNGRTVTVDAWTGPTNKHELTATFNVVAPTVNPTVSVESNANTVGGTGLYTAANGVSGINAFYTLNQSPQFPPYLYQAAIQFAGCATNNASDTNRIAGITFCANAPQNSGFQYQWVQVLKTVTIKQALYVGTGKNRTEIFPNAFKDVVIQNQLDNFFPYAWSDNNGNAVDVPTWIPGYYFDELPATYSYAVSYSLSATMWLICKPASGGIWVPLAKANWGVQFDVTATGKGAAVAAVSNKDPNFPGLPITESNSSVWTITSAQSNNGGGGILPTKPSFVATSGASDFPSWSSATYNTPGIESIWYETWPPSPHPLPWDWGDPGMPALPA